MSFFNAITGLFSNATAKIVDSIGNAIDKNLTTDHERLQMELELQKVMADLQKEVMFASKVEQEEITKRLQADMAGDSWLPKNIRPLALIFVTVAVMLLSFLTIFDELTQAQVNALDAWVGLWTAVLLTIYGFYFGSRGLEKIASAVSEKFGKNPPSK